MSKLSLHAAVGGLVLVLVALPVHAQPPEPGVWWESTVEMETQGHSMPARTQKFCAPKKGIDEPPGAQQDDRCKLEDLKHSGNKMTWRMACSGPDAMSGEGEMEHTGNGYTGRMTMRSEKMEMRMKMRGKLLGGDCDAAAPKREMAAAQKQAEASQAQSKAAMAAACEDAVTHVNATMLTPPYDKMCSDPAYKTRLCQRLETREGFIAASKQEPDGLQRAGQLCNKKPEAIQKRLCPQVLKDVDGAGSSADTLEFIGKHCPDETKALAQRECAGRSYTGLGGAYRGFCTRYAREQLGSGQTQPGRQPQEAKDNGAVEKGKKAVRGLLGF